MDESVRNYLTALPFFKTSLTFCRVVYACSLYLWVLHKSKCAKDLVRLSDQRENLLLDAWRHPEAAENDKDGHGNEDK